MTAGGASGRLRSSAASSRASPARPAERASPVKAPDQRGVRTRAGRLDDAAVTVGAAVAVGRDRWMVIAGAIASRAVARSASTPAEPEADASRLDGWGPRSAGLCVAGDSPEPGERCRAVGRSGRSPTRGAAGAGVAAGRAVGPGVAAASAACAVARKPVRLTAAVASGSGRPVPEFILASTASGGSDGTAWTIELWPAPISIVR